jgi:squalene-hopene/tetraprenyl-beta-curcumene cyclase
MRRLALCLPALILACDSGRPKPGAFAPVPVAPFSPDLAAKFLASYERAADWLAGQQDAGDGSWGQTYRGQRHASVGITCLATFALANVPPKLKDKYRPAVEKGVAFILRNQETRKNDDPAKNYAGGFSELPNPPGQLRSYVTSLAIMVLAAVDKAKYKPNIDMAVEFLRSLQATEGFYAGGTGYGEQKLNPDGSLKVADAPNMSTTAWAADAMEAAGVPVDDEYWKRVAEYVARLQQNAETNVDPEWIKHLADKGIKIGTDGSIIYSTKVEEADRYAGAKDNPDGTKTVTGYGSMTYAGIKTYLYAGLRRDDPKVKAAVDWVRKRYTVDYHPGFDYEKDLPAARRKANQGIFYYYLMMAKALDAYGENPFVTADGVKHDWSQEIAEKLMSLQAEDGTWVNPNPRWWEEQPALVTPYVLIIYSILSKRIE